MFDDSIVQNVAAEKARDMAEVGVTLNAWEDEFLAAQLRFPRGVFSDGTALFLHGFTDRAPFQLTMTFPRSYRATKAREAGVCVRHRGCDIPKLLGYARALGVERKICNYVEVLL